MHVVQFGDREVGVAQAVGAMNQPGVFRDGHIERGGAEPGQTGRVQQFDDRLHVDRRLLSADVAPRRGHGDHFQPWIEERQRDGQRVVDARVHVENHLPGHTRSIARGRVVAGRGIRDNSDASRRATEFAELSYVQRCGFPQISMPGLAIHDGSKVL